MSRERTTFMIDEDVKDDLEMTWLKLRRIFRGEGITKSSIVETALRMALEDFKAKKEDSKFCKRLRND